MKQEIIFSFIYIIPVQNKMQVLVAITVSSVNMPLMSSDYLKGVTSILLLCLMVDWMLEIESKKPECLEQNKNLLHQLK